jgi:hypothetical protein
MKNREFGLDVSCKCKARLNEEEKIEFEHAKNWKSIKCPKHAVMILENS